ncbi:hypothetical protein [Methanobacterium petrolearium]|uniref:hypothetical protein n=1 Tax=Methanobacterium petrolearium TaxID=710190 RepID=UPI003081A4A1|nr:hypothetical protein GCM10025861_18210 [Methanobacterium petrolearium]
MSDYKVDITSQKMKDKVLEELGGRVQFERKANIHGACVKLLTDNEEFKEEWEDNFKFMNEDIRPHAKIFSVEDGETFMYSMNLFPRPVSLKIATIMAGLKALPWQPYPTFSRNTILNTPVTPCMDPW